MRRAIVICEGQSEQAFVSLVLAPSMMANQLYLQGITVETSKGHKGGALSYERFRRATRNALAEKVDAVTTFIDLYRLDSGFPGYSTGSKSTASKHVDALESALHADIVRHTGCRPNRFIPHIQPHEFEALLFSDVARLAATEVSWSMSLPALQRVRNDVETPEHIDHGDATKPSAQLKTILKRPSYRKMRHGPTAAGLIGLGRMAQECPHFAAWLAKLRAL